MTTILFVCRQNIGRSQMAMAIFNKYANDAHADSVGTIVEHENQTLAEYGAKNTIQVLLEQEDIDASGFKSNQLSKEMLAVYDKIIVMAEPENIPDWLSSDAKTELWTIPDTKTSDLETTRKTFAVIKSKVLALGL
jgi:protein-tyrosine-phosphatase